MAFFQNISKQRNPFPFQSYANSAPAMRVRCTLINPSQMKIIFNWADTVI